MSASVEGAPRAAPARSEPCVSAVVVSHNGARWLPRVLDGLAAQTRLPDDVVLVDTGSLDGSYDLAVQRLGPAAVVRAGRDDGVGAAIATALEHLDERDPAPAGVRSWVWVLHDDSAPAPDALAALLREVEDGTDLAVVGPKLREWPSLRRLLEVGVTITGTGHRQTGLEPGEPDQGQHDGPRDVLAVSSAGMLVRRDVWAQLGGFDPHLPLFCDDIDFGWRANRAGYRVRVAPEAVVSHAEAASRGLRGGAPIRAQRRGAVYTLLANASSVGFAWQYLRLLAGSVVRVLALLLVKSPRPAWAELRGTLDVYLRPWRLFAARRRRRRTSRRPARAVRPLLPSPTLPYRHGADAVLELCRSLLRPAGAAPAGRRVQGSEPGPVAIEAEDLPAEEGPGARLARHPWAACVVLLIGVALWSGGGLLGSGLLQGGALLPAPDSAGRWWSLYLESWHPVGIGSDHAAPPYVLVLAIVGTLLAGQAWLVVDLLLLAAVPLCALTAHRLARRLFGSRRVRLWWSVTYAVVPVVTGAVGEGRLGTVVGAVLLPLVVSSALALVLRRPGVPAWQRAVRLGLWLSLLASFVPLAYPMAAGLLLLGAALTLRGWRWLAVLAALLVPAGLLGPWVWSRWSDPSLWWWEAGLPTAGTDALAPDVPSMLGAGASGVAQAPMVLGLALLGVALAAFVRTDRQRALLAAWLGALAGLGFAVGGSGTWVELPTRDVAVPAWIGFPLVCWWGALAVVAGLAADGVGAFLARRSFGWRQPFTAAATVVAVSVSLAATGWWALEGGTGVLSREPATRIPDYLAAAATAPVASSTLVLAGTVERGLTYSLVRDDGTRLGEEAVAPTVSERASFDADVAGLLSDPSLQRVSELADYGVGAVYALPPVDVSVAAALDSAPGLQRSGAPDAGAGAWQLTAGVGSVRVLSQPDGGLADAEGVPADANIAGPVSIGARTGGVRQLRLAAPAATQWSATGPNGKLQAMPTSSGTQTFALATSASIVELDYDSSLRRWRVAQLGLLVLLALAALPGRRRHR